MVWFGLVWFGLVWFGLVWFGLVWFGLVWFGLVWFGLVWFGDSGVVMGGGGLGNSALTFLGGRIHIFFYIGSESKFCVTLLLRRREETNRMRKIKTITYWRFVLHMPVYSSTVVCFERARAFLCVGYRVRGE